MVRWLQVCLPLLAASAIVLMARRTAATEALPRDLIPNGSFVVAPASSGQPQVSPADVGWEAFGWSGSYPDMDTPPADTSLVSDPRHGPVLRAGDATATVLSPWIDVPQEAQALTVHLRAADPHTMALVGVMRKEGGIEWETTADAGPDWIEKVIPLGNFSGQSVRLDFQALGGRSALFIGEIDPPRVLLPDWGLQAHGGADTTVTADPLGRYLRIRPGSIIDVDRVVLSSRPFTVASPCSSIRFATRSVGGQEWVGAHLVIDGADRWLGPFEVDEAWQSIVLPVSGLAGKQVNLVLETAPNHELDLREIGILRTNCEA